MKDRTQDYYSRLEKEHTRALWQIVSTDSPDGRQEPTPLAQPYNWKWERVFPLLQEAVSFDNMDRASERRVSMSENDGLATNVLALRRVSDPDCDRRGACASRNSVAQNGGAIRGGSLSALRGSRRCARAGRRTRMPQLVM